MLIITNNNNNGILLTNAYVFAVFSLLYTQGIEPKPIELLFYIKKKITNCLLRSVNKSLVAMSCINQSFFTFYGTHFTNHSCTIWQYHLIRILFYFSFIYLIYKCLFIALVSFAVFNSNLGYEIFLYVSFFLTLTVT